MIKVKRPMATEALRQARMRCALTSGMLGEYITEPVFLRADGTLLTRKNCPYEGLKGWTDVRAVFSSCGRLAICKADGSAYITELPGRSLEPVWTPLPPLGRALQVAFETHGLLALMPDGTLCRGGDLDLSCIIGKWRDNEIVSISAGNMAAAAVDADGKVAYVGQRGDSLPLAADWEDVVQLHVSNNSVVGIRADGQYLYTGSNTFGQDHSQEWTDCVQASYCENIALALRSDGTVLSTTHLRNKQHPAAQWTNIASLFSGFMLTLGIRTDGTVVCSDRDGSHYEDELSEIRLFESLETIEDERKAAGTEREIWI